MVPVLVRILEFWFHILNSPAESLLHEAYLCGHRQFHQDGKNKWFSLLKNLCQTHPTLQTIWDNHSVDPKKVKSVLHHFKMTCTTDFKLFWQSVMEHYNTNGGRLQSYSMYKSKFCFEPYLDRIQNLKQRHLFTKLRISAHQLAVETGRYRNIPREERVCGQCDSGAVENEIHLLLFCPAQSDKRTAFMSRVLNICPELRLLPPSQQFNYLMTDHRFTLATASFFYTIYPYHRPPL